MARRFDSLLNGNPELRPMLSKAGALAALQRHFEGVAPPYFAQSGMVTGLQSGVLSVVVANATAAAKLRQLAPQLVHLLQNRGCEVSGIRVKVQVAVSREPSRRLPRRLSGSARCELGEFSAGLEESPLRRALEKWIRKPEE